MRSLGIASLLLYLVSLMCILLEGWGNNILYISAWIGFVLAPILFGLVLYRKQQIKHKETNKKRHWIIIILASIALPTLTLGLWLNRASPHGELIGFYIGIATYIGLLANSLYTLRKD